LIAIFIPFRSFVVSRIFSEQDLNHLDPVGESNEDYLNEQRELYHVEPDVDESEVFHGFSELRMKNVDHNPVEYYQHHPDAHPPEDFAGVVLRNRRRSSVYRRGHGKEGAEANESA
jgi:hypothetical protein